MQEEIQIKGNPLRFGSTVRFQAVDTQFVSQPFVLCKLDKFIIDDSDEPILQLQKVCMHCPRNALSTRAQVALKRKSANAAERLYLCLAGDRVTFVPSELHPGTGETLAEGCSWTISSIGLHTPPSLCVL